MSSLRRLVFFGDSLLSGLYRDHNTGNYKSIEPCFPDLIAHKLGIQVENLGLVSHSNAGIANDILNYLRMNKNNLEGIGFVICWTEFGRGVQVNRRKRIKDINSIHHLTGRKRADIENDKALFGYVDDDEGLLRYHSEAAYHAVRQLMTDFNIPYIMCQTFDNTWFDNQYWVYYEDKGMVKKQDPFTHLLNQDHLKEHWLEYGKPHNTLYDMYNGRWGKTDGRENSAIKVQKDFEEWTKNGPWNEYMLADGHANEKGHEKIAEIFTPYLQKKFGL
jgi:hypothetical protein